MTEPAGPNATYVRRTWSATLDMAAEGRAVIFHRDDEAFVLLQADLLRDLLARAVPAPEVIAEEDGWTVLLQGHPVASDGSTLDAALDDFVVALRDYATAWDERLHRAPNHQHAAALVQHVTLSDDKALLRWARGTVTDEAPLEGSQPPGRTPPQLGTERQVPTTIASNVTRRPDA
jgi:hypothetical protein